MKQHKYIIVEYMGHEVPIIFAELIEHSTFTSTFKIVSAGFCNILAGEHADVVANVWGESDSLKKVSRPEDAEIIERFICT